MAYVVTGGGSSPPLDADAQANLAHATRVSPATVRTEGEGGCYVWLFCLYYVLVFCYYCFGFLFSISLSTVFVFIFYFSLFSVFIFSLLFRVLFVFLFSFPFYCLFFFGCFLLHFYFFSNGKDGRGGCFIMVLCSSCYILFIC